MLELLFRLLLGILAHFIGDYPIQSHKMATRKTIEWKWALIHAMVYGIPFLFLVQDYAQWLVIVLTHAYIDHYKIADRWCRFYGVGHPGLWWTREDGEFVPPAPFIGVWLTIIVDNTFHLCINTFALSGFTLAYL